MKNEIENLVTKLKELFKELKVPIVASLTLVALVILMAMNTSVKAGFSNGFTGQPAPQAISVNLNNMPYSNAFLVVTGNIEVVGVSAITTNSTAIINFYDTYQTNIPYFGTNYVTTNYVSRSSYPTNTVYSFVGYNGYTNWYTNLGTWSYWVTNTPATNALPTQGTLYAVGGTIASLSYPMTFQQGLCVTASTNVSLTIYYIKNQ